jgi:hypothetical protein
MLRFKIVCGAVLILAFVMLGGEFFMNVAGATPVKPPAPPPVHSPFQMSQTYVAGNPAIKPHLAQNGIGPAFTKADVAAYLEKYGFYSGPLAPGAHLKILTIEFVTAAQASQLMVGESVGRPDNYLVCYIKVEGPFLLTYVHGGVPGPHGNTNIPTTAKYGDAVFDAHTGNLLVWGVDW